MIVQEQPAPCKTRQLPPPPVKRFLDHLFVDCGLEGYTVVACQRELVRFWRSIKLLDLHTDEIDVDAVQHHLGVLRDEGVSVAKIAQHLASIKMFLRYLYAERLLPRDVAALIENVSHWQLLPGAVCNREVMAMLDAPDESAVFYQRDRAILELLSATGLRVTELVDLSLRQVNFDVGYLRIPGGQGEERVVPIGNRALDALEQYVRELRPQLVGPVSRNAVFLSRTGRPMDRSAVWRMVRKCAVSAGSSAGVPAQELRHGFAAHVLGGGANVDDAHTLLGDGEGTRPRADQRRLKSVHRKFHPRQ